MFLHLSVILSTVGGGGGGVCVSASVHAGIHPQQTAATVDSTHPTGMHSCYVSVDAPMYLST